jgi:hypothetical protein
LWVVCLTANAQLHALAVTAAALATLLTALFTRHENFLLSVERFVKAACTAVRLAD